MVSVLCLYEWTPMGKYKKTMPQGTPFKKIGNFSITYFHLFFKGFISSFSLQESPLNNNN